MSVAFLPEWGQKIKATRSHETLIEEGLSQKESRHNVSSKGLWTLKWQWYCSGNAEPLQLREFMRSLGDSRLWIPFWPDCAQLVGSFPMGVTELVVDDIDQLSLSMFDHIVIWQGLAGSETLGVSSVTGNTITLSTPTQQAYAEDGEFYIFPALYGRLSWKPKHETDDKLAADMTFNEMMEGA